RQLHLVFEPTGESFNQYVLRRRLEACRAALASPAEAGRSIVDIAFGWGFDSLSTFYRTFHRAFGIAPGDLPASAQPGDV
ncbi:MAG TPA: helix-turn-helix transcriptional regulator, partial [Acidisphaera sp.]|nr:helix-turn-helix transcriptional regulator [Acidisphaera sp.]